MWNVLNEPTLPVILIDNVAEYYFTGNDQEYWSIDRDFPNLAPPFPIFWMEHKMVKTIHSRSAGTTDVSALIQDGRVGMLFGGSDPEQVQIVGTAPEGTRWILWMELWIDYGVISDHAAQGPHGMTFMPIDEQGRALTPPYMQTWVSRSEDEEQMKAIMTWYNPALLAISFLHCKNVVMEDHRTPKPLAKRYFERRGVHPTAYKTLIIEPLKAVLRKEGASDKNGLAKAMHICRGHFADYREGRGLFGKYKKLVWMPQTLRGSTGTMKPREMEVKL
jgi:hypothetical protein